MTTSVNQPIEITSLAFAGRLKEGRLEAFPKRMVWDDREYSFVEIGMHFLVKKGQELIRLFDVSDGQNDYRLKCDDQNRWTLVSMKVAA
jgi:hypothetical protein